MQVLTVMVVIVARLIMQSQLNFQESTQPYRLNQAPFNIAIGLAEKGQFDHRQCGDLKHSERRRANNALFEIFTECAGRRRKILEPGPVIDPEEEISHDMAELTYLMEDLQERYDIVGEYQAIDEVKKRIEALREIPVRAQKGQRFSIAPYTQNASLADYQSQPVFDLSELLTDVIFNLGEYDIQDIFLHDEVDVYQDRAYDICRALRTNTISKLPLFLAAAARSALKAIVLALAAIVQVLTVFLTQPYLWFHGQTLISETALKSAKILRPFLQYTRERYDTTLPSAFTKIYGEAFLLYL